MQRNACRSLTQLHTHLTGHDRRRKPLPIDGDLRNIKAELVIYALGSSSKTVKSSILVKDDPFWQENLIIRKDGSTNFPGLFVGGDNIRKQGTAVQAIADGRYAAIAIDSFLTKGL